jgi:hypothetical protein
MPHPGLSAISGPSDWVMSSALRAMSELSFRSNAPFPNQPSDY